MDIRKQLMQFILEKVKEQTNNEKPYFIVKWSGLAELTRHYGVDLLEIIDDMVEQGLIKKALIPTKNKRKLLALCLPERATSKKTKEIINDFENFLKKLG